MQITRHSCPNLKEPEFSGQFSENYSYIKFHENPSSGSQVVSCGPTDGWTDMTMSIVAFRNFANALRNVRLHISKVKILYSLLYRVRFCHFLKISDLVLEPTVILYPFVCRCALFMRIVTSDTLV
jgi:hypothetical protein